MEVSSEKHMETQFKMFWVQKRKYYQNNAYIIRFYVIWYNIHTHTPTHMVIVTHHQPTTAAGEKQTSM